jgi:FixJ family two-component response regulator
MNSPASFIVHIIDDDDSLRTALSRLLMASGYRVALHESGLKFLDHPIVDEPGCILLDVDMPGLSGLQLQEHLVKLHSALPIVFLTGNGDIAMSVKAIKAGAEDFLSKPVEKDDLVGAIERGKTRYQEARQQQVHLEELRRRVALLTARELEVFKLVILGMLNKQIAFELGNTERTVKAHRHSIMEKMQVQSLAELVLAASQLGMLNGKDTTLVKDVT